MATHRRIVRSSSVIPEIESSTVSIWTIAMCQLSKFAIWTWRLVKILWYWFERLLLIVFLIVLSVGLAWWTSQKPSLYRDWEAVDSILPQITWSGNLVNIHNVRNYTWKSETEFTPGYLDLDYRLDEIEGMQYIVTPFSEFDGPAHAMVSFSFSGGRHIVISPEIRKEKGEGFDAVRALLNQYELYYAISTEDDIIKLRTNYRANEVYMYPIKANKEEIQGIFRSMLLRSDKLMREGEFYNTLWNNCVTNILSHANAFRNEKLRGGIYTILPAHSDELIYNAGLINTKLSLDQVRKYYRIDESARSVSGEAIFSEVIHKPIQ